MPSFITLVAMLSWAESHAHGLCSAICCGGAYELSQNHGVWTAARLYPF